MKILNGKLIVEPEYNFDDLEKFLMEGSNYKKINDIPKKLEDDFYLAVKLIKAKADFGNFNGSEDEKLNFLLKKYPVDVVLKGEFFRKLSAEDLVDKKINLTDNFK